MPHQRIGPTMPDPVVPAATRHTASEPSADETSADETSATAPAPGSGGEPRQAVVFIHGVGDQPPMRSLRSFTQGIGLHRLFSSPDRITESAELRRLSEPPTAHRQAHTEYFELYWAHLAPDGDWRTTVSWYVRLLLRRDWWRRRGSVRRVVIAFQLLVVAALGLLGWAVVGAYLDGGWSGLISRLASWQVAAAAVLGALGVAIGRFLRAYLSDAVRYLTPRPANIASRQAIRSEGLELLRRLHASCRYRRIIVVGHSLGSVIGLDLLRALWDEMRHPDPLIAGDQGHIAVFDAAADRLDPGGPAAPQLRGPSRVATRTSNPEVDGSRFAPAQSAKAGTAGVAGTGGTEPDESSAPGPGRRSLRLGVRRSGRFSAAALDAYQEAQFALWQAGRADGIPWLITDFVSLGAPLTYASMLLDEPDVAFGGRRGLHLADLQGLKEVPRCPPIHDELEDSRFYTRTYRVPGGERRLKVGHTAAPFGPTRWTNLYLPATGVLRGDLFAGPVAPSFGPGARDVPVRVTGSGVWAALRRRFPLSHLSYWWSVHDAAGGLTRMPDPILLPSGGEDEGRRGGDARASTPDTIVALVSALRLDDITRVPGPAPPPTSRQP